MDKSNESFSAECVHSGNKSRNIFQELWPLFKEVPPLLDNCLVGAHCFTNTIRILEEGGSSVVVLN